MTKGRSLVEIITLVIAVFIIIGFLIGRGNMVVLEARKTALKSELSNLRLAVFLYHMLYKEYPQNLEMLINRTYEIKANRAVPFKGTFIKNLKYAEEGKLKDPFGEIYLYNPYTGMINSQSKGYKDW
ncbi:MAG: hypothetical protein HQ572_00945 [Candidatus Omnitrophica bacterium]|nr:hypothetical protein [Candidatus Omnitrophota bacterium]